MSASATAGGFDPRLDRIAARAEELRSMLGEGLSGEAYAKASKELAELAPVEDRIGELRAAEQARAEAEAMLTDPELRELAEAELDSLRERIPKLEHDIRVSMLPKDEADERSAILELRPAAGGDEAALVRDRVVRDVPEILGLAWLAVRGAGIRRDGVGRPARRHRRDHRPRACSPG